MKKLFFALVALLCLTACSLNRQVPKGTRDVPFEIAHGYFFRNGQPLPSDAKITSEDTFRQLFGMAAVIGKDGMPTVIDFSKQFVIALVMPVTDTLTEIEPQSLRQEDGALVYTYEVHMGDKQTWSMQPVSIIVVDNQYAQLPLRLVSLMGL